MPNWCDNDLTITGPPAELEAIAKLVKFEDNKFDFNEVIQYPKEYRDQDEIAAVARKAEPPDWTVKDGYNQGGYDWCIRNWGTKWNGGDVKYDGILEPTKPNKKGNKKIFVSFDTAWSPPTPVICTLAEKFPSCNFTLKYYEQGCGFKGTLTLKGGKVVTDSTGSYRGSRGG